MVLRFSFIAISAFLIFSCNSQSSSKTETVDEKENNIPMNNDEARAVYTLNCASCHGNDGALKAANAADLTKSKFTESQIENVILNGNAKGMMPYKDILSKREVKGLVNYIPTLRK